MPLRIDEHWLEIQRVVAQGQSSSIYCSVASINPDGTPNVSPIGTVFLRENMTGFYFDPYTSALSRNLDINPNICVTAVNSGFNYWFRSLLLGRFTSAPGVRLYGVAGPLRAASAEEKRSVDRRVRATKWLKGSRLLWSKFTHVRDLTFTSFRPVVYPVMMERCWGSG
jgi:hypothetical protein